MGASDARNDRLWQHIDVHARPGHGSVQTAVMSPKMDTLTADCSRCAGLCCVAFAFDRSEDFGHDKPADTACHHLAEDFSCTIHEGLADKGYRGCVRFDCHGAGQRVVQNVFGGRDWRSEPALMAPMMAAFRAMRRLYELLHLLDAAKALSLDATAQAELSRLIAWIDPDDGWTAEGVSAFDIDAAEAKVAGFLKSLAPQVRSN